MAIFTISELQDENSVYPIHSFMYSALTLLSTLAAHIDNCIYPVCETFGHNYRQTLVRYNVNLSCTYRAANSSRSSDNGRRKSQPWSDILSGQFFVATFDYIIYKYNWTFLYATLSNAMVFMSDQIFLLSDQNGALVRHLSFQGKKIICSPDLCSGLTSGTD